MLDKNISQEFTFKKIDQIGNYLIDKTQQNDLMSKHKNEKCMVLNYTEHVLVLVSTITGCVSIFAFA